MWELILFLCVEGFVFDDQTPVFDQFNLFSVGFL